MPIFRTVCAACQANLEAVLEQAAERSVRIVTPTGSDTSRRCSHLTMRQRLWADQRGGWIVFDCSGCFRLPDGSVLSPDAALVKELASTNDEGLRGVNALRRKMELFQANGAQTGRSSGAIMGAAAFVVSQVCHLRLFGSLTTPATPVGL